MQHGIISRCVPYLLAALVVLCTTLIGGAAARYVSLQVTDYQARAALAADTDDLLDQAYLMGRDIHAIMQRTAAAPFPPCSDHDLTFMRGLILHAYGIRDLERIQGQTIMCSALLGVLDPPLAVDIGAPDFMLSNGIYFKQAAPVISIPGQVSSIVYNDRLTAVLSSQFFAGRVSPEAEFELAFMNPETRQVYRNALGGVDISDDFFTNPRIEHHQNLLASTRCAEDGQFLCIALAMDLNTLRARYQLDVSITAIAGCIAGAALGMLAIQIYLRSQRMENRLRRTLRRNKLHVVYQPVYDPQNRRTVGAEALARWRLPDKTLVSPEVFIPLAEQHGLVHLVTRNVVHRVIEDSEQLLRQNPDFYICINISAADLSSPDFADYLHRSISTAGIRPSQIRLEITERSAADPAEATPHVSRLQAAGHHLLLDDFGTGHSNLTTLSALNVDGLKLDRGFTTAIGTDSAPALIVPRILEMASALRLSVITEGVETQEQADYLMARGVQHMQGWLFGKPSSIQALGLRLQREVVAES